MKKAVKPALEFTICPEQDATNIYAKSGTKSEWVARIKKDKDGFFCTQPHVGFQSKPDKYFYQFLNSICTQYAQIKGATVSKINL